MFWLCVLCGKGQSWSTTQSCVFLTPEWVVQVQRWSPRVSNWNFRQPQVASGFSVMTGIWAPMVMIKKVCQRLGDQTSSLRWVLICPSQLIGLKKRILLGTSSSWDSRPVISVRSTKSSTVVTMWCCERKRNCSARLEPENTFCQVEYLVVHCYESIKRGLKVKPSENGYLLCGDISWNNSVWTHICRHIGPRRDVKQR